MQTEFATAKEKLETADAILVGAGAGMGVDSGLPDFRGNEGFWKAYPPFKKLGLSFYDLANPQWFRDDPERAWGFYGHRLNLYRATEPHTGFNLLLDFLVANEKEYFVFTSNVDGHFQRAGYDPNRILECHGAIESIQCSHPCGRIIDFADQLNIEIDDATMRAKPPLPVCQRCGSVQRPNILMFGDWNWVPDRTEEQSTRYELWLNDISTANLVAIEFGAGTAVPTVRHECERRADYLIRVNPREADASGEATSIWSSALPAIQNICQN